METWLQNDWYNIPGLKGCHKTRQNKTGGGVSIYKRNSIAFVRMDHINIITLNIESIFIKVTQHYCPFNKPLIIGVIYCYDDIIDHLHLEDSVVYMGGDFNIDLLRHKENHRVNL